MADSSSLALDQALPSCDMNSTNNIAKSYLWSKLEKDKLNLTNFNDWYLNLRTLLKLESKEYVLNTSLPGKLDDNASQEARDAFKRHFDDSRVVTCLMLVTMTSELQKQFENVEAYDMTIQLKNMFKIQASMERYETIKAIFESKLEKGKPVGPHVLKMIGYFQKLGGLGFPFPQELATDIILCSLHDEFDQFTSNFIASDKVVSLIELHFMLTTVEKNIKVVPRNNVLMVSKGKGFKKSGKKGESRQG